MEGLEHGVEEGEETVNYTERRDLAAGRTRQLQ